MIKDYVKMIESMSPSDLDNMASMSSKMSNTSQNPFMGNQNTAQDFSDTNQPKNITKGNFPNTVKEISSRPNHGL